MIKYSLSCAQEHGFEAWFASSEAYEKQRRRGLVMCPACGSKKVAKALMAPRIGVRQNRKADATAATTAMVPAGPDAGPMALPANQQHARMLALMREMRQQVEKNAEYVGPRFADEARKIHHDESPARGIYGEATVEEAKALAEDGIEAYPLPRLPEDGH